VKKLSFFPAPFDSFQMGNILVRTIAIGAIIAADSAPTLARAFSAIDVRGAEFIPEDDIRMTCGALPGVDYMDVELIAIQDCLMTTGVFEQVKVFPENDTLVIDVVEIDNRPGRVEATLSYVSQDGITAEFMLEQYNLFPKTYGALNLSYNTQVKSLEANLYRADAFGSDLDLGLMLLGVESDYDDRRFSEKTLRFEPYLAWTPHNQLRIEGAIGLREYSLFDVNPAASPLLQLESTDGITGPYLRLSLGYESDDSPTDQPPTPLFSSYSIKLDQFFWNIGTSDPLSETRVAMNGDMPLTQNLGLRASLAAGTIFGLNGNDTRSIDRFYPGADTFRGFAPRGIGPRDGADALGGNNYLVGALELQRDMGSVLNLPLTGGIFVESGATWGLDNTLSGSIDDTWKTRTSLGMSVSFDIGQTPVSLYLARPLRKETGDETQMFGIKFTALF
jgi:outer membrane protein insertion porin family